MALPNPFGVVALLRQRPGVAFDDHWQLHRHRFADASRPRLANEEIGKRHVVGHLLRESFDEARRLRRQGLESLGQFCVASADEDQLRVGEPFRNLQHDLRALSAEQHQSSRKRRVQAQPFTFARSIHVHRFVKARAQNHTRCRINTIIRIPQRTRLLHRFLGPANEVLLLSRLHPEVRWVIRKIRQDRDVGYFREGSAQALVHRAVEIGHQ